MTTLSAVLFVVFNRPVTTARVFESIRKARPPRLYVVADGPRATREDEAAKCEMVRNIATSIDWPCKLITTFHAENQGCKRAVSSGISWFFEHESEGIILEDDCVPDPSFFAYCDDLLERYRNDGRVMCISGDNFISHVWQPESSYYFSKYPHIWGWATWRRAWQLYDVRMDKWHGDDQVALLSEWLPGAPRAQARWRSYFDGAASGRIDAWDYQWVYACWRNGGVSTMPRINLISNIGFGKDATNTVSSTNWLSNLPVTSLEKPLRHPAVVEASRWADEWSSFHVFDIDERLLSVARVKRALTSRIRRLWASISS